MEAVSEEWLLLLLPTPGSWEELTVLVDSGSVAKLSFGLLLRILSVSCLARNVNEVKDKWQ